MYKTIFLFSCFLFAGLAFSQRKEKAVNLVFFDKKFPRKCSVCDAKTEAEKKDNALIVSFIESVKCKTCPEIGLGEYVQMMSHFADTATQLTNFGKAQIYYRIASDLMRTDQEIDGKIFNPGLYQSSLGFVVELKTLPEKKILDGATEIQSFIKKASQLTNEEGLTYLKHLWLKYMYESRVLSFLEARAEREAIELKIITEDDWFVFPNIDAFDRFMVYYKDLSILNKAAPLIQDVSSFYQETGYNPNQGHDLITPSFNYSLGNTERIGGELAFERAFSRNPYRLRNRTLDNQIYARISFFFGYNQEIRNSAIREFYFGSGRVSQASFVYVNFVQFGWKHGIDPNKSARWFYRPEVGLAYGNFQVFYSYTHMFNKDMRPLVDRHAIHLRFTLPYLRVSHYD